MAAFRISLPIAMDWMAPKARVAKNKALDGLNVLRKQILSK
jgi:hypothetical protein